DDLLKLAHRSDDASEHDVLACRGVNSRRQQLRRSKNRWRFCFNVLESRKMSSPNSALVRRYTSNVVGISHYHVGVEIDERLAHLGSVFLIHAEDDGLSHTISLLEELGEMHRDCLRAGT